MNKLCHLPEPVSSSVAVVFLKDNNSSANSHDSQYKVLPRHPDTGLVYTDTVPTGSWESLVTFCLLMKTPPVIHSQPTAPYLGLNDPVCHSSIPRENQCSLAPGNTGQHFSTGCGGHFIRELAPTEHKQNTPALSGPRRGRSFVRAGRRPGPEALLSLSCTCAHQPTPASPTRSMSVKGHGHQCISVRR